MWFFDPTLLLFLLLPVAAFSGWVIGRRHDASSEKSPHTNLPTEYLQGLNYFLNEQPDKAIDLFIQMLEVNKETVETHLALGNLFRRRGEADRAIRIHQNLISRPMLPPDLRAQAMYELGQDFMRAGLLDRAEDIFKELLHAFPKKKLGVNELLDVYQQEREWQKAISIAQTHASRQDKTQQALVAHYYCELAELAIKNANKAPAASYVEHALECNPASVRASILQGDLARQSGDYTQALTSYQRIESQAPEYLSEVIASIVYCYQAMQRSADMLAYLRGLLQRHGGVTLLLQLAEQIQANEGEVAAANFAEIELQKHPSLRGLNKLLDLHLGHVKEDVRKQLNVLKTVITQILENRPTYQCQNCGFGSRVLYWHCPGCHNWNTIKPVQGIEGGK
jgi:lipopolysaccharide assembly protein B